MERARGLYWDCNSEWERVFGGKVWRDRIPRMLLAWPDGVQYLGLSCWSFSGRTDYLDWHISFCVYGACKFRSVSFKIARVRGFSESLVLSGELLLLEWDAKLAVQALGFCRFLLEMSLSQWKLTVIDLELLGAVKKLTTEKSRWGWESSMNSPPLFIHSQHQYTTMTTMSFTMQMIHRLIHFKVVYVYKMFSHPWLSRKHLPHHLR